MSDPNVQGYELYAQSSFRQAEEAFTRAIKTDSANPSLLLQRSRARLFQGDWPGAGRDREKAFLNSASNPLFLREWLQILLHQGAYGKMKELLGNGTLKEADRRFWLACAACRQKKYSQAANLFGASNLFHWAALALAEDSPEGSGGGLTVVGLGYRKIAQMSVGGVRALKHCGSLAVVANVIDDLTLTFLGLFDAPLHFIVFRGEEREARAGARSVIARCSGKRRAGLVTRGHPIVFGRLSGVILEEARRRRVPCEVWAAVSGFDELPAAVPGAKGAERGMQVIGCFDLREIDTRLPLVVYAPKEARGLDALAAALERNYPRGHHCWLMPNSGPKEFEPAKVRVGDLRSGLKDSLPCALYVPCLD